MNFAFQDLGVGATPPSAFAFLKSDRTQHLQKLLMSSRAEP